MAARTVPLMTSCLLPFLRAPDHAVRLDRLQEQACFRSPVADYHGRADVAHLVRLIASVLADVRPTRQFSDGRRVTTFLTARVDGRELQGVLDEALDDQGCLEEATLMLRPLGALRVAIDAMRIRLEAEPLPSRR